ncbi:hypothetical protein KJ656_05590 [bacterium]|nr:hypothetical protein [bacterium]
MALIRGFSRVDEAGKIKIPGNIQRCMGLEEGRTVLLMALRIQQTSRYPHAVLFVPSNPPKLSQFEVIMDKAHAIVESDGKITIPSNILEEMRLGKDYRIEMKVQGPHNKHWLVIYNRGPWRETTLRKRMGVKRGDQKKSLKTQVWDY